MRIAVFFYLWLAQIPTFSQNINIRIYSNTPITAFYFTASQGKYEFLTNNKVLFSIDEGESITFSIKRNKIHIDNTQKSFVIDSFVQIRGSQQSNFFTLISPTSKFKGHGYDNDLYVKLKNNTFELINDVNFDKYVAGVVEAEGGSKAPGEYYKAQAVLCRTYAARFYAKHLTEGYNLCDGVHCQAYNGRCKLNLEILDASTKTSGLIIVDSTKKIVSATFYANSGGQTVNSEDMWVVNHYYLRSKPDPYSVGRPGFEWQKQIPLQDWKTYLQNKGFQITDSTDYTFEQTQRQKFFNCNKNDSLLELKTMRTDLKLRSTFFSTLREGENIIIKGKGYGHGVGLSQEGAMEMARQNFTYDKIIKFYFSGVQLMNMTSVNFFKVE